MNPIDPTPAPALRKQLSEGEQTALWAALDELTDPEIPVVTLREMGIVRALRLGPGGQVEVIVTPTYSGCPAMEQITADIVGRLAQEGVAAQVVTQLAPAWTTDWMSEAARAKLRDYGIAPPPPRGTLAADEAPVLFAPKAGAAGARGAGAGAAYGSKADVPCPRCGSANTTEISHFGSTACKALYRCLDCLEPFDHFKRL